MLKRLSLVWSSTSCFPRPQGSATASCPRPDQNRGVHMRHGLGTTQVVDYYNPRTARTSALQSWSSSRHHILCCSASDSFPRWIEHGPLAIPCVMLPKLKELSRSSRPRNACQSRGPSHIFFLPIRCLLGFQTLLHEFHYHAVYRHKLARLSRRSTRPSLSITVSPICDWSRTASGE